MWDTEGADDLVLTKDWIQFRYTVEELKGDF